jgi:hypothetical protein
MPRRGTDWRYGRRSLALKPAGASPWHSAPPTRHHRATGSTAIATSVDITNAVCDLLIKLRVELALVDELHNISLATRAGAEASDQLKYLSERYLELKK